MKLSELQKQLDVKKLEDSKLNDRDMCGTYNYCQHCNKKNKYPCAAAYKKAIKLWSKEAA